MNNYEKSITWKCWIISFLELKSITITPPIVIKYELYRISVEISFVTVERTVFCIPSGFIECMNSAVSSDEKSLVNPL
jgi:hypothetical protein